MKNKLSVVLATRNEQQNIGKCLESVKAIADEIIVFDENSKDKTRDIARKYGAKVKKTKHHDNFHITKQKAIDAATGDWILQLDADERVPPQLGKEILEVIEMDLNLKRNPELDLEDVIVPLLAKTDVKRKTGNGQQNIRHKLKLFKKHQKLIEKREGFLGKSTGEVVAFFIPRVNYFLGGPLVHAGVYPDGVIRLIKSGKARLPGKSVHELMEVDGEVGWLFNDLEHHESPTLKRYIKRMNRYTDLHASELKEKKLKKNITNFWKYSCWKPKVTFLKLYIRHKGFLDGIRGFLWSFLSAMHFPIAYYKYWTRKKN
jgi:glycosyltransferase involved in cell wall biosynthesis